MTSPIDEYRARLRVAMDRMTELRDALAAERRARREPIAVIGVGGRFPPDRSDPDEFFAALLRGEDATADPPPTRFPAAREGLGRGGWLRDVRGFDAAFFGISPREAAAMDPQQRLLLECSWEALERAGQPAERLAGGKVGVFVGLSAGDYLGLALERGPEGRDIYALTGNGHSFAAGRLAFTFGLQGPCLTVDTACSSSLVAIHLAVRSLRDGDSALAVAAGVNLILSATGGVLLARSGALAPDGRCKTFDASADGFTRGEGCGVVILKRLADARRDRDPILAVIRGSATNQDGRSTGFTAPSVLAQEAMLRQALADAGLTPDDIGYIETHGTGTALGDPIELAALGAVFSRPGPAPILGALKTNLGHLEAAAGVVGVIKAVLSLHHGVIPPNLHFNKLNPLAAGAPFTFPTTPTPWPADLPRRAGVSSFGMSGSNAHIVLEAAPPDDLSPETSTHISSPAPRDPPSAPSSAAPHNLSPGTSTNNPPSAPRDLSPETSTNDPTAAPRHLSPGTSTDIRPASPEPPPLELFTLSARAPEALTALAARVAAHLETTDAPLADLCHTANLRRSHHPHRLAALASDRAALARTLAQFAAGDPPGDLALGHAARVRPVFVFSGQGSVWPGMARDLLAEPAARAALTACDEQLAPYLRTSIVAAMLEPAASSLLHTTELAQPALFALSLALTALLRAWGVEPAAVLGHSVGEIAAAHVAGALTLADAARLVCLRGQVMQRASGQGAMAAVDLSPETAARALLGREDRLAIAAINGPTSVVLAGDPDALDAALAELQAAGARTRRLRVDHAFHSPQMRALQPELRALLGAGPTPQSTRLRLFSTVTGEPIDGLELGPAHWIRGLVAPVLFARAVGHALAAEHRVFIEVGPHPTLVADLRAIARDTADCRVVGTLWRDRPARPSLLKTLAELHVAGQSIDFAAVSPREHARVVPLPTYPWQHRDHWLTPVSSESQHPQIPTGDPNLHTSQHDHLANDPHAPQPGDGPDAPTAPATTAHPTDQPTRTAHSTTAQRTDQPTPLTPGTSPHRPADPAPVTPPPSLLATLRRTAPEARRAALQRPVRAEVAQVLGLTESDPLPPRQGLFDLGLDSMMAVELKQRLERRFGVPLAATLVFEHPTIDGLAAHIADALGGALTPEAAAPTLTSHDEPIAIVGMACRFPGGANDPARFWDLLETATDAIVDVPPDRWDADAYYDPDPAARGKIYARRSGFLKDLDVGEFDAAFFRISPAEARGLDPQQRLLLELTWEALEDAGQSPDPLVGSRTGVYVGIATADYAQLAMQGGVADMDPYVTTGTAANTAAGRLSHFLGLRGPAIALDTACSSSLVAAHLGCQSLRRGETDLVLVGGVNLMLAPFIPVMYARMGTLAPDSRCKAFDAAADGMVRGEGCGVLILKRLSDAQRDGDRIHAIIRGSAINHDGRSGGLTVPSGSAQREVLRAAMHAAGVVPASIAFVETHGTGTSLGDPIEANALVAELGRGRPPGRPLLLGAAKASIGHLEAAAGMAGLIKTILALQRRRIPPQRNFSALNPAIDPGPVTLVVPTQPTPWPDGPRIAGVSSFGMSGTNAHMILEAAPESPHTTATESSHSPAPESSQSAPTESSHSAPAESTHIAISTEAPSLGIAPLESPHPVSPPYAAILPISARSPAALRSLAAAYRDLLRDPTTSLPDLCAAASLRRAHLEHRLALTGTGAADLLAALDAHLAGDLHPGWSHAAARERPRLVMVFAGHSGHWVGMGRSLYADEPVFRAALDACATALAAHRDGSLIADLHAADAEQRWSSAEVLQPLVLAVQLALAELWSAWGVAPQAVVGHSMGEIAAACFAGALTLDDALRICVHRSRLIDRLRGRGAMASVALTLDAIAEHLAPYRDRIAVAAANSPQLTVVSGDPDAIRRLCDDLARRNVFARVMPGATAAGHSPQLDPLLPELAAALTGLAPQPTRLPFYSTVTAGLLAGEALGADYWQRNLREPVRFTQTLQQLADAGLDAFLEISPGPLLLGAIEQTLRPRGGALLRLGSLKPNAPERPALLTTLGRLFVEGLDLDWSTIHPRGSRAIPLPTYPWQRQRHWLTVTAPPPPTPAAPTPTTLAHHTVSARAPHDHFWDLELQPGATPTLQIQGLPVLPTAQRLDLILAAHNHLSPGTAITLEALELAPPTILDTRLTQQLIIDDPATATGRLELLARRPDAPWTPLATAHTTTNTRDDNHHTDESQAPHDPGATEHPHRPQPTPTPATDLSAARSRCTRSTDLRATLRARGLAIPDPLWAIDRSWTAPQEALARILPTSTPAAILESALQLLADLAHDPTMAPVDGELFIPRHIERLATTPTTAAIAWAHATLRAPVGPSHGGIGDLALLDEHGRPALTLNGVRLDPPDRALARRAVQANLGRWLYDLRWQPAPPPLTRHRPGAWLLLADAGGLAHALAARLQARGDRCLLLPRPTAQTPDFTAALRDTRALAPLRGVVHLWSLDGESTDLPTRIDADLRALLQLVHALAHAGAATPIHLATRGAEPVRPGPLALAAGPLWGMARTIHLEHPELPVKLLDLDPGPPRADELDRLIAELDDLGPEDLVAHRDDTRLVARLLRLPAPAPAPPLTLRPEATYLISGGLGGVGLQLAAWLVDRGARHLVLVGRSGLSQETSDPRHAALRRLESLGAKIRIATADVADLPAMSAVFTAIPGEHPLRGVFHLAGASNPQPLLTTRPTDLQTLLRPKVGGAWVLHTLSKDLELDHFVGFSSAAATWGAALLGPYSAANHFLDLLAHHRRAHGLPALSVDWGGWSGGGMADADVQRYASDMGLVMTPAAHFLESLDLLIQADATQATVATVDWRIFKNVLEARGPRPLLAHIEVERDVPGTGATAQQIAAAPAADRWNLLVEHVRERAAAILGFLDPHALARDQGFFHSGMDSVMSVRLRNDLERSLGATLPPTLAFEQPSVDALATWLAREVLHIDPPAAPAAPTPVDPTEALQDLSEADLAALLAAELESHE